MKVRITNIQRFSLHDGPGIRTTVFLKGCSLKCPWCSNPENINFELEKYFDDEIKNYKLFGYDISLKDLETEIFKDYKFYQKNNGGVTFSGGEPLLQFDRLEPLLKNLKKQNINICVETSLFVPKINLEIAIKYVDEFYVDIKILNRELCKKYLNGNLDNYYKNVSLLFNKIPNSKIIFRIPVTKEFTLQENNGKMLFKFLDNYKPKKVEIFKIHSLGQKKYSVLDRKMKKYKIVSDGEMIELKNKITVLGIDTEICVI